MKKRFIVDAVTGATLAFLVHYGEYLQWEVKYQQRAYDFWAGQLSDGAYAAFSAYVILRIFPKDAFILSSFILVISTAKEIGQLSQPERVYDPLDILAYSIGALSGYGLAKAHEFLSQKSALSLEEKLYD